VSFADLESALAALEERGARAFDRDGCDLVRTLIVRGQALPPPADALMLERVRVHLARLGERYECALAQSRQGLEAAERIHGALPEQRKALERGEFRKLRHELRRLGRAPEAQRESPQHVFEQHQSSAGEYLAVAAELNAQFTVARAVDEVPLHAGPYNPLRIATELLSRIGAVSPTYLTAQLKRFDELAVLLTLPEPPPIPRPTSSPPPKKARGRAKRRRSA
jgi:hypothetical protein